MTASRMDNWIKELHGLPSLTRAGLEALQLAALNDLLSREKKRGGFYRHLPEKLDSLEDLKNLPFTTPKMLSENAAGLLLTSQADVAHIITGTTSGTTGTVKRLFYTGRDLEHTVGLFTVGIGQMAGPGDKVLIAMPFSGPYGLGNLIEEAVIRTGASAVRSTAYSAKSVSDGAGGVDPCSYNAQLKQIRDEQPTAVIGFPVPLLSLVRLCDREYGRGSFPIKSALISGDACPEGVTSLLENECGITLFPHYGSREMALGGAVTCQAHSGMHLRENHVLAEIVDSRGEPVPDGEWGELVITTLDMEAMPLIRYRTGDRTRFLAGECPCGSVTKRLDRVSRIGAEKDAVSMEELDGAFFVIPDVIDLKAGERNGGLSLVFRLLEGEKPAAEALSVIENARQIAAARFPGVRFEFRAETCHPGSRPFYPGKRVILEPPREEI